MTQIPICVHCRRVLDLVATEHGTHYAHTIADSHEDHHHSPVPTIMQAMDRRPRCDFCTTDSVTHTIPARSFDMPTPDSTPTNRSIGDWAACDTCAQLVHRNQWTRLEQHVAALHHDRNGVPLTADQHRALHRVWRRLRANIVGPPHPNTGGPNAQPR